MNHIKTIGQLKQFLSEEISRFGKRKEDFRESSMTQQELSSIDGSLLTLRKIRKMVTEKRGD